MKNVIVSLRSPVSIDDRRDCFPFDNDVSRQTFCDRLVFPAYNHLYRHTRGGHLFQSVFLSTFSRDEVDAKQLMLDSKRNAAVRNDVRF